MPGRMRATRATRAVGGGVCLIILADLVRIAHTTSHNSVKFRDVLDRRWVWAQKNRRPRAPILN